MNNRLSSTIPPSIGSLAELQYLYVTQIHAIVRIADLVDSCSMRVSSTRDMSDNQLSGTIPSSIVSLVTIVRLYVSQHILLTLPVLISMCIAFLL